MTFLPLSASVGGPQNQWCPVRTGGENSLDHAKVSAAMTVLLLLLFLLLLVGASAFGLTADTRDSADWKPSDDGQRWRSRTC
ncbi:hypothetical protein O7607_14010 [Micromonospora sp. WMMA1949]|nr:hypothetical protein [Micromonospora sp. WMMA1949]MCZ7426845.1 hypothetical protein [Micromonospora sp. WMMA1949]